ncbi:MAG: response regulator transcription factor [Clostridiales bacterium]|nr:response regulator transcription factor [Clostridiales bacterium]
MKKVLIVEDEKTISDIIKVNLLKEGYSIIQAYDGKQALEIYKDENPDLILLDVMLPYIDGFQVCRKIREKSNIPIVMLTAKEEEVDKVLGLELGADDYITKPFGMRELIARVKANIRRVEIDSNVEEILTNEKIIKSADLVIDLNRYEVRKNENIIELTKREFELLTFLASQDTQVFTREQLLKDVWGYEYFGDIRTVDVTVRRMREKIEEDSSNPKFIMTKRGVGYYFRRI